MVPRVRNWKFFFRWTSRAGEDESAVGDLMVTDVRSKEGFPQDGQNFFDESLHILASMDSSIFGNRSTDA